MRGMLLPLCLSLALVLGDSTPPEKSLHITYNSSSSSSCSSAARLVVGSGKGVNERERERVSGVGKMRV